MKAYFAPLDVVRFFAAFWVMNFHYFQEYDTNIHWYRYGNLGVQLFFIISGFVIVQSLKGKSLKEFALGRFLRLFPLFWILCTVTYIITFLVPDSNPVYFTEYLLSMTMLGDKFDPIIGYTRLVDAAYWTLAVELIFYAVIAIFVSLFSYKRLRYFFLTWFVVSIFAFATHHDTNVFVKLALVRHASYFIFGGMLALIVANEARHLYEKYFDWALLFASACYATYIHPLSIPGYLIPNPLDQHIITLLHIAFFTGIGFLVYISPYISNKKILEVFIVLGGLTYPLYLMHQTIGNAFIKYFSHTYGIPGTPIAWSIEILMIAIAYVVYMHDKKMRRLLRNKLFARDTRNDFKNWKHLTLKLHKKLKMKLGF